MANLIQALWTDDNGFVLSAELVLVSTVVVLGLLAGLACVRDAISGELTEVAQSFRSLDQSFYYGGMRSHKRNGRLKSWTAGSAFGTRPEGIQVIEQEYVVPHREEVILPAPEPVVCPPEPVVCPPEAPLIAPPMQEFILPQAEVICPPVPAVECQSAPLAPCPTTPCPSSQHIDCAPAPGSIRPTNGFHHRSPPLSTPAGRTPVGLPSSQPLVW